jgi:hypothetical protein
VWMPIELQGTRFWTFRALISGWEHRTAGDVLLARYGCSTIEGDVRSQKKVKTIVKMEGWKIEPTGRMEVWSSR